MIGMRTINFKKRIVFRFYGGIRDGQEMLSDCFENSNDVRSYWMATLQGTVGRRFDVSTAMEGYLQRYQVVSKYDIGDEIHITCEPVIQYSILVFGTTVDAPTVSKPMIHRRLDPIVRSQQARRR